MIGAVSRPGAGEKLEILSADAQYDLACACGTSTDQHRKRGGEGNWIYPVTLPNGGKSVLFKTLVSNVCTNDCKYCPLRQQADLRRASLSPDETAEIFLDYLHRRKVSGLFLSSAVPGSPDGAMARLNAAAEILRNKHGFRGYIHLKIIPGASSAAIEQAVSLATAVSLNIETPGQRNLERLSKKKDYIRDIIEPMKLISRLTARGSRYSRVKQTTQFIVGAAGESDADIVKYTWGLYDRLKLQRVYFSAYQKGLGDKSLPAEQAAVEKPDDVFTREHRLYQVDFLFRKYGFGESDIIFDNSGRLSLNCDPKETWAANHAEFFPVDVNHASRNALLKVPGLGPVTVDRILQRRKTAKIRRIEDFTKPTRRLLKTEKYLLF